MSFGYTLIFADETCNHFSPTVLVLGELSPRELKVIDKIEKGSFGQSRTIHAGKTDNIVLVFDRDWEIGQVISIEQLSIGLHEFNLSGILSATIQISGGGANRTYKSVLKKIKYSETL